MAKDPVPRGYARNLFGLEGRVAAVTGGAQRPRRRRSRPGSRRPARRSRCSTSTRRAWPTTRGVHRRGGRRRPRRPLRRHRRARRSTRGRERSTRLGARRRARQQRRHRLPLAGGGLPRGSLRRDHRAQPQGHVPAVPGVRPADARARSGAASSTSRRSAASSPTRTRSHTCSPRAASCSSPAGSRWSGVDRGVRVNAIAPTLLETAADRADGRRPRPSPATSSERACCATAPRPAATRSSAPRSSSPATPRRSSPAHLPVDDGYLVA